MFLRTHRPNASIVIRLAGLALLTVVTAAAAGDLPKLPGPLALPQSGDSPGVVTFNHETHVDADKPACTTCHPRLFKILKASPRTPIVHDRMKQSQQCGACHDGKKAFAPEDCTACHRS
jgi:c(7)-type cytochrome triheme protein